MTPREKFITALELKEPPGRVPHFELVFFLTMEAFGRIHPAHRYFTQWKQMSYSEQELHRRDIADLYLMIAEKYEHSAIFFHPPAGWGENEVQETIRTLELIRELSEGKYFVMIHGDATYAIPSGDKLMDFIYEIADNPRKIKDNAQQMVDQAVRKAEIFEKSGVLDGFALCNDYCFNAGPFISPSMFDEFITPYLAELIQAYRQMGFYVIKHTDGNIMPILDSLVAANPHALHSLDPQGGIDIAKIKRKIGHKVCLIGNVNCSLLDTGTENQVVESVRYALKHGMPNGGYIFSTSNCIYTGMNLKCYELMLDVWKKEGNYQEKTKCNNFCQDISNE
ncbi:MAG: uroporphyrinogen decarboxylase family protein [Planctomycetota bacterium]